MLMSVDGKISMGAANDLDGDKNLPNIAPLVWNRYMTLSKRPNLGLLNFGVVQEKKGRQHLTILFCHL